MRDLKYRLNAPLVLLALNYEVTLLPKMWVVPRAERNFIILTIIKRDVGHGLDSDRSE